MEADKEETNCREVLMDSEGFQEEGLNDFKGPSGSLDTMIGAELLTDCSSLVTGSYADSEHHGTDFSALVADYPVCVSPPGWTVRRGGEENPKTVLECVLRPESERHVTELPVPGGMACSARDGSVVTAWSPHCADRNTINAAAHLHLLGESLSLIGQHLQESDKMLCASRSLCVLLDSLLCAVAPLMGLTTQIPELRSCMQHTMHSTLENIAYLMPGL